MENTGDDWHRALAKRIGEAVAARRKELGMTAQQLASRCGELGVPIHRTTITKIENGRPRFDLGELIVLAAALDTAPITLIYPGPYNDKVEVVPGYEHWQLGAAEWFSGVVWRMFLGKGPDVAQESRSNWRGATRDLREWRRLSDLRAARSGLVARAEELDRDRKQIEWYDKIIRDVEQQLGINDDE